MPDIDWDLLTRWAAGECADAERARVEQWLASSPEHTDVLRAMRAVAVEGRATTAADRKAELLAAAKLGRAERTRVPLDLPSSGRPRWPSVLRTGLAAAAVLAAVALGSRAWFARSTVPAHVAERVLATPRGQRAMFHLLDGTRVMLAPASTLRYAARFDGGSTREVRIEGEAYFEVAHDDRRPFVVRAGDAAVQDVGTQFVVRAYPEDAHAQVVVREGRALLRAAVAASSQSTTGRVLGAGELGRLSSSGDPVVQAVDPSRYFAWTAGRLVFDGTLLRDALPQLSRWYDLEFRLADPSLGGRRLSATLKTQLTADELDFLAASLGLRQVRHGHVVTLY